MRKFVVSSTAIVAIVLAMTVTGVTYTPGMTQGGSAAPLETMTQAFAAPEVAAASALSTRAGRAAVAPLALPIAGPDDLQVEAADTAGEEMVFSTGGGPNPAALAAAQADFAAEWIDAPVMPGDLNQRLYLPSVLQPAGSAASAGTQAVAPAGTDATLGSKGLFTSYVANYFTEMHVKFPFLTVGKLYFSAGYCSATVISPNNIIVTAAHCVYNTDRDYWYSDFQFVPAYRNGSAPLGVFPATNGVILTNYAKAKTASKGSQWDIAMLKLGNNSVGKPVTYYTGWLGMAWNQNYVQSLHATGYPYNLSSGNYSYFCAAESFKKGTDILGLGCNMTNGSSGGPWLLAFQPFAWNNVNYVSAVTSFGVQDSTWGNTFYGPRFTSSTIGSLCNGIGC